VLELIIGVGGLLVFLLLLIACSCRGGPSSGRVQVTRPKDKSVDGFGGARGYDYSYSGQSAMGGSKPFPVGLRMGRKKTDTHDAYSKDDDDY